MPRGFNGSNRHVRACTNNKKLIIIIIIIIIMIKIMIMIMVILIHK